MKITLTLTARCNAGCDHCSTSCGPRRTEHLSREQLLALLDEAAALSAGGSLRVSLTGGEPFLDFDTLLAVVRHGSGLGATVITCVTNGYWATSPSKARTLLCALKEAGLTGFAISTSCFHEPFVAKSRVACALNAGRDVGLPCGLKYVRARSEARKDRSVSAWARRQGANRVELIDLMPTLRDGVVLPDQKYGRRRGLPRGRCPAAVLSIAESGEAFTCGAPGSRTALLSLGDSREGLEGVRNRFQLGAVQHVLRRHGPIHFAREIARRGEGQRLRTHYAGVCDLCTHIAGDAVMASIAQDVAAAYDRRWLEGLLARIPAGREPQPT